MLNWIGLATEFLFVFAVIGVAHVLWRSEIVGSPVSRKIIHIGVSHWWFLAMYFHDSAPFAAVGPVVFIALNYYTHRKELLKAMEDETPAANLGTVYFPISLLVLVLLSFGASMPLYVGGIGILTLGYGDGLASLVGNRVKSPSFVVLGRRKSVSGTLVMFLASAVVAGVFTYVAHPEYASRVTAALLAAAATAAVATSVEFATPWGLDNLTVPIFTALFYHGVFV
ncbi:MAG: diacylglycerol/polyprenol kinase family protein [Spirochaetota bacterium]